MLEAHYVHTFSWVDYSMDVVYGAIPIDVSMAGVVGGQSETTQGTTLVQVQHINALMEHTCVQYNVYMYVHALTMYFND